MTIEWLCQRRLVDEERSGIERLVTDEVIDSAAIIFSAALRDDIDHGAAIIAVLSRVVIAQNLNLGDSILAGRHTDLVRAAGFAGVQAIDSSHS